MGILQAFFSSREDFGLRATRQHIISTYSFWVSRCSGCRLDLLQLQVGRDGESWAMRWFSMSDTGTIPCSSALSIFLSCTTVETDDILGSFSPAWHFILIEARLENRPPSFSRYLCCFSGNTLGQNYAINLPQPLHEEHPNTTTTRPTKTATANMSKSFADFHEAADPYLDM